MDFELNLVLRFKRAQAASSTISLSDTDIDWVDLADDIKHEYFVVDSLRPSQGYKFRVLAQNRQEERKDACSVNTLILILIDCVQIWMEFSVHSLGHCHDSVVQDVQGRVLRRVADAAGQQSNQN